MNKAPSKSPAPKAPLRSPIAIAATTIAALLHSPMAIAICSSVLLHASFFGAVKVVEPEAYNRIIEDTPLEVILVNARSDEAPDKPQAIAQHNLNGGGNLEQQGIRATSPLPPSPFNSYGNELGAVPNGADHAGADLEGTSGTATDAPSQQQIDTMQRQQMELLTHVKKQLADLPAAWAVGVVGVQGGFAPFALPHQCVGCLRECGAVGVAVGSGKGFVFEGDGDIDSAVALFFQACKCASKVFRRAFDGFVSEVLLLLLGKTGVYPGRTAVCNGVADNTIAAGS